MAAHPSPKPARKLGNHGSTLWKSIMSEYIINDSGGLETLTQACQSLDTEKIEEVASSHVHPKSSEEVIVAAKTGTLEGAMPALGQKRTCAVQNGTSAKCQ